MKIISDNETLMRFVPNSISPVKGESPLYDKIEPFIESAERWVEQNFTGEDLLADLTMLNPKLVDALRQLVACDALNRSVPSLDLVLTPNGFGVVVPFGMDAQTLHIDFIVPQGWHELTDAQLRYVYNLIAPPIFKNKKNSPGYFF